MAGGSSLQSSPNRATNYHIAQRSPLTGLPSCSALQLTSSPQPPVTPPIGRCCSTPKVSLNSGSPPVLVHGLFCDETFAATRRNVDTSSNTAPAGSGASVQELRELVRCEARERAYGQLALSNKLREQQDEATNIQALVNSNFSELRKELAELHATVVEKLGLHGSSEERHMEGTGTEATSRQVYKDTKFSILESMQEQLNARLQCTQTGLQEVRDALQSLKQREDLRLQQDEVALRRLQDGLDGFSSGTETRAFVRCSDEDSEQQDALLSGNWAVTRRFSSCSSSVFRDVDKDSFDGDGPSSRSLDRRLQELRSESQLQMADFEKQVKEELASLRGWIDAAIFAVINRLGLLEKGQQTPASAEALELKLSEPRQATEGSHQPLLENCKGGGRTSAVTSATRSSYVVTRSNCEGRSFSRGRQLSIGPGMETSDIAAPASSEGNSRVVVAAPSTSSQRIQVLTQSSQSQSALTGQASAGMALPQVLSPSPQRSWAYINGCSQGPTSMSLVLPPCSASSVSGGASARVRSSGPPNSARATIGIPSAATTALVPGNGAGTPKVGGNVATNQNRAN